MIPMTLINVTVQEPFDVLILHESEKDSVNSRVHPLLPSAILGRPQYPGSQRSHLRPPTPGLHVHCRVLGSQVALYAPSG